MGHGPDNVVQFPKRTPKCTTITFRVLGVQRNPSKFILQLVTMLPCVIEERSQSSLVYELHNLLSIMAAYDYDCDSRHFKSVMKIQPPTH
jgi:hypothetical protein